MKKLFLMRFTILSKIHEFKAYLSELGKYPKEKVSKIAYNNLHQNIARLNMSMQPQKTLLDTMSHSGPCIPGQRRLFIDVNGNFFPLRKSKRNFRCDENRRFKKWI